MKTVNQLVEFLFHSSKELASLGDDQPFFEELSAAVPVKVLDKQPLVSALKKAGIEGLGNNLKSDASGLFAEFDNTADYQAFVGQLVDGGKLYDLASYGWVATYCDDTSALGDTPKFRVNFLDIGEVEPGDTKGHESEDADIMAMDREAVAAYKEVNDLTGRKDQLKKKEETATYTESRKIVDNLSNAAQVVDEMLRRSESKKDNTDNTVTCPKCHTGHVKQKTVSGQSEFECQDCGHTFKR